MLFTESALGIIASAVAVVLNSMLMYKVGFSGWMISQTAVYWTPKPPRNVSVAIIMSVLFGVIIYFVFGMYLYDWSLCWWINVALTIIAAVALWICGDRRMDRLSCMTKCDGQVDSLRPILAYRRKYIVQIVMMMVYISPLLYMGVESLLKWIVPDVTVVRVDESGKSDFIVLHDYRVGKGLQVNGSYVENETSDTIYRVVVSYAIPGEHFYNAYSITDTVMPWSVDKMKGNVAYSMRLIPPLMPSSNHKGTNYRTKRVFLVDASELNRFVSGYDMSRFGLKPNKYVKEIDERNAIPVKEDGWRLEIWRKFYNGSYMKHSRGA
ncbi:MAG: hypothetical protein K2G79_02310 [Muribaculum sp.]|nr:hypothetical protein [Muribaculum sp.]